MKTLIAEDDASSRILLHGFLSRYGECDIAINGKQAVQVVRAAREDHKKYDLVCMDLRMPEMDGQEAMREIRKQEAIAGIYSKRVKIIVTTGLKDGANVTEALQGQCDAYLLKPVVLARLLETLKNLGLVK